MEPLLLNKLANKKLGVAKLQNTHVYGLGFGLGLGLGL